MKFISYHINNPKDNTANDNLINILNLYLNIIYLEKPLTNLSYYSLRVLYNYMNMYDKSIKSCIYGSEKGNGRCTS